MTTMPNHQNYACNHQSQHSRSLEVSANCGHSANKVPTGRALPALACAMASMLLLTACAQKDESSHLVSAQTESSAANGHSQKYLDVIDGLKQSTAHADDGIDANRQFVQLMRSHQQAAVMMAYIELKYGTDADARSLAQRSIDIQQAQMSWMDQWLSAYQPQEAQHIDTLPTIKPSAQHLQSMSQATQDSSPDKAFILLMQLHQTQALAMIRQVNLLALDAEVQALAEDIYDTQSAQIEQMQAWLNKHQH